VVAITFLDCQIVFWPVIKRNWRGSGLTQFVQYNEQVLLQSTGVTFKHLHWKLQMVATFWTKDTKVATFWTKKDEKYKCLQHFEQNDTNDCNVLQMITNDLQRLLFSLLFNVITFRVKTFYCCKQKSTSEQLAAFKHFTLRQTTQPFCYYRPNYVYFYNLRPPIILRYFMNYA